MTIPFQPITVGPSLADVLTQLKKDVLLSINCHAIATVQSVDYEEQTLVATINYSKTFFTQDQATGVFNPVNVNYPILLDVPFVILGGGQCSITFPIAKGDQCIILFNDRDIDNWFAGATSGPVATGRLHALADGMALVGLNANVASYDPDRAVLQNGSTMVGVSDSLVKIANEMTTLKTVLNGLIDAIATLVGTGTCAATPGPVVFSGTSSLTAYKSTVEGLLE